MPSEYELACTECGIELDRTTVSGAQIGVEAASELPVAICPGCGGRYYPEEALERLR